MRILIADDHEMIRKGIRAVLSAQCGLEVCGEASNGREAVDKARELRPDLVIMDVTMPLVNGFQAAREIRAFLTHVPILFLSMHQDLENIPEQKLAAPYAHVNKAQTTTALLQALRGLVETELP